MTTTPTITKLPERPAASQGGGPPPSGVPWATVLPLAVPLGLTASFWTVALRTSLGSIERTGSPFASWARESALLLPFFVLAVLAALTLAQRRYGRDIRGFREVGAASLLVTAFGTLAGVVQLGISSAYDYHLQVSQMATMASMQASCPADCQGALQQATLGLQERAVLVGGLILLVSNIVVVAWVTALRGWRLRLTSTHTSPPGQAQVLDRLGFARTVLVSGLVGSAAIHAAVVPEHLAEWTAAGVFFVLLALVEMGLGALVVVRRDHVLHLACLAVSVGPLLVWLGSRTAGLPFGPEAGVPEAVGLADVAACLLEVATAVAALSLLRSPRRTARRPLAVHEIRFAFVLVVAVSALGLGGTDLHWVALGADGQGGMHHAPASPGVPGAGVVPDGPLNHG